MQEETNNLEETNNIENVSEIDFLNKVLAIVQRHNHNLKNISLMMKSGHFIDANQKIIGSSEGLMYLKNLIEKRTNDLVKKDKLSEEDTN